MNVPRLKINRLGPLLGRVLTRGSAPAVSDADLTRALGVYVGMVDRALTRPERWLGVDSDPTAPSGRVSRALHLLRRRLVGQINPTSAGWPQLPLKKRVRWWVRRITLSAGTAAAAPRVGGLLADRLPVQDALGASAAGLSVCATARELGVTAPTDWVPLVARVVFGRHLVHIEPAVVLSPEASRVELETSPTTDLEETSRATGASGIQRAGQTVWHLARTFLELDELFDERPRGGLLPRLIGKFPVVGIAGGWLDERGAIRKAARQTARLISEGG